MTSRPQRRPSHHWAIIGLLIGAVGMVTLMPSVYLLLHAMRWTRALYVLERLFPLVLLLAVAAGLLAYQRVRERARRLEDDLSADSGQKDSLPC